MKQTIGFNQFCDGFRGMNRNDNFTHEGKKALFDFLEDYEEASGEGIEFDVIALCCEYTEYKNLAELQESYSDIESIEELEEHTTVIKVGNEGLIIQNY